MTSVVDDALEEVESHRATLSITFLLACLYLGLTAIATNDQQLLLDDNLTLQPFSVPVGLTSFFVVAPAFIFVLHSYILFHQRAFVVMLGRSSRKDELEEEEVFLRFPTLSAFRFSSRSSEAWVRFVKGGLFVVYVALPLLALCVFQAKYRPRHSWEMTLWHQFLIVTDLGMTGYFLLAPQYQRGLRGLHGRLPGRLRPFPGLGLTTATVVSTLVCSLVLAFVPRNLSLQGKLLMSEAPSAEIVAAFVARRKSRELAYLRYGEGASLRSRDLRSADLAGAKLFNADLGSADLGGARLFGADLRRASLTPVGVDRVVLELPRGGRKTEAIGRIVKQYSGGMEKADLRRVNLREARLILANLTRADLREADLIGVELTGADLRGAFLQGAHLEGAEVSYAKLDGAYLSGAHLEGATFDHASLVGASLVGADAVGASFVEADLGGARMAEAHLLAADFRGASLAGSDLRGARLQGATSLRLEALDARGAHLGGACPVALTPAGLVDFRFVDFLPYRNWAGLRSWIQERLKEAPEAVGSVLARIDAAKDRGGCFDTPGLLLQWRKLLYFDEQRAGAMQGWPPVADQSRGRWDEEAFHRELASELVEKSCSKRDLAYALAWRGAGEANPGDLDLDMELARQIEGQIQKGGCSGVEQLPRALKRQIEWRLRAAEREEDRDW